MPRKTDAHSTSETYPGAELSSEEVAFLRAIERYQHRHRKKFLAWSEVLTVVRSLGYRKVQPESPDGDDQL